MYNYAGSAPILTNVVFDGNTALLAWGGGIRNIFADVTLLNATFSNNDAYGSGGAISSQGGTNTITNSILWGNAPAASQVFNLNSSTLVSHSLIQGSGGSGTGWNPSVGTDGGNNLDTDPMFVDAPGGNLRLNESSPAVNAGDSYAEGLPSTDIDGNPRIIGADVDMGAYETQIITGISNRTPVTATRLDNAWPNPFNPTVTITYQLKTEERVTLSIYDVAGRLIKRLVDETKSPGTHQSSWNGLDRRGNPASSGVYFVVLRAGNGKVDHRKITLLK
jgi:predicted outer membrane repeat protein